MPSRARGRRSLLRLVVLLGFMAGLSGCAYYNTFYLARKYYTQGEAEQRKETTGRLSPTAAGAWDKSIKQAQKVLKIYPNSKWVDDALFLVGKAYFGREEYGSARQYFQQLLDSYPGSEFALESRFWMARTWAAEADYVRAGEAFKEILAAGPPATWADQVLYAQGEVEFAREDYSAATDFYRQLLERYPNGTRAFDALSRIGDASFQRRQWAEAQKAYNGAMPRARESKERLDLRLKAGQCLEKLEKYDEALDLYRQTALELVPLSKYNQIVADPLAGLHLDPDADPNDPSKSGTLNPDDPGYNPNGNNQAGSNQNGYNPTGTGGDPNQQLNSNFGSTQSLSAYQQAGDANRRAAADAIQQNPLAAQMPRILLRQGLCLSARGDQKGAIGTFRAIVTAYRGTAEASEAQYRIGYINEVELQDYTAARKAYDEVKTQGQSLFGEQATKRSGNLARLIALAAADTVKGARATQKSLEAEAERAFLGAELYMFQQDKPDKALEQYTLVEADFPKSSFAPRAALARAWILTNAMGDTAAGAQTYRDIVEKYPGSDAWRMAYQLVNGEPPKELPRVAPPVDSLLAAAGRDSAAADSTRGLLELAPSPDLPPTPLPTLTSGTAAADSAARAAFPVVPGGAPATPPALPVVPGEVAGIAAAVPPPATGGDSAAAIQPATVPAAAGDSLVAVRARVGLEPPTPTTAAPDSTSAAPVAPTPAIAAVVPAPNGVPANAITPGTPQRMRSRVVRQEVAAAAPRAWADWQRWLKSPASRRVIPAPRGTAPRPAPGSPAEQPKNTAAKPGGGG